MRPISPRLHRGLDLVTVGGFALAPALLGLAGPAAGLAYLLALVHLTMTLFTGFASPQPIPLWVHGAVEAVVGIGLVGLPWLLRWDGTARVFYTAAGAVILLVWSLSRYRAPSPHAVG